MTITIKWIERSLNCCNTEMVIVVSCHGNNTHQCGRKHTARETSSGAVGSKEEDSSTQRQRVSGLQYNDKRERTEHKLFCEC